MTLTDVVDVAVVGGGIVGLATARAVLERFPGAGVVVLEKEAGLASHQSGRNSGVLHSGVYYKPGSLKAAYCREGLAEMIEFCRHHHIAHEQCGKVIVACEPSELGRLAELEHRASAHGIEVRFLSIGELREREPHVRGVAALHLPVTGIVDYVAVCAALAEEVRRSGGSIRLQTEVRSIRAERGWNRIATPDEELRARVLVNCAGLHSDRVAARAGAPPESRIVPFRGEYYELVPAARVLVRHLVYPVPDLTFPFLGVHLTRMIDGSVHAGPNAVVALRREGYRRRDVSLRDMADTLGYAGFWRLARRHWYAGTKELARSLSAHLFLRSLQRLVPELGRRDIVPAHAGVRAQALARSGALVDDFVIVERDGAIHVCNAPSPAATSSLRIGRAIAERVVLDR